MLDNNGWTGLFIRMLDIDRVKTKLKMIPAPGQWAVTPGKLITNIQCDEINCEDSQNWSIPLSIFVFINILSTIQDTSSKSVAAVSYSLPK